MLGVPHFLDHLTRSAIISRIGATPSTSTTADLGRSVAPYSGTSTPPILGATIVGVDLVAAGVDKAHRLVPRAQPVRADVCELPTPDRRLTRSPAPTCSNTPTTSATR